MAKQIKLTKEDLRQEQALTASESIYFWLRANFSKIILAVAVVFLAYAIVLMFQRQGEKKSEAASDLLYKATVAYERGLGAVTNTPERSAAMAEARLLADQVISQFGDTSVARNAQYLKGNAFFWEGDSLDNTRNTAEAIRVFQEYHDQAEARGDAFERAAALLALGYANENLYILSVGNQSAAQNAFNAALRYYGQIAELGEEAGFLRYEAMNAEARMREFQGEREEAEKLYREVFKESFRPVPAPGPEAGERRRTVYELATMANQFTTGQTARLRLQQMGVDVDALEKESFGVGETETQ